MSWRRLMDQARAYLLALMMALLSFGTASAHGVPGSVLILSQKGAELTVTVQMAAQELTIAAPKLAGLMDVPMGEKLSPPQIAQLQSYFADHFTLAQGAHALPLTLSHAAILEAQNHHTGAYPMLVTQFTAPLEKADALFPLTLTYDAVMHEVRSHSATVYWATPGARPIGITQFYYRPVDGKTPPILLEHP